jgi:2-iminoacetate synthase
MIRTEPDRKKTGIPWLDYAAIEACLDAQTEDPGRIRDILDKALDLGGLSPQETAALLQVKSPELAEELFVTAGKIKAEIYGPRIVLFAPLYISNICANACAYCAFSSLNSLARRSLTIEQIIRETEELVRGGHKRILLVAGEDSSVGGLDYVIDAINAIYGVKIGNGEIRRVNANLAPLDVGQFRRLKEAHIGTYQLFQETYHLPTYYTVHISGPKRNFAWRTAAMDRAMEAGIDDVGMGVLFGLYDWKFEVLAMMQQIAHLEERFGVGPHTISVPRIEPAAGSDLSINPPFRVSDNDFVKLVAVLRLSVPYTGIIMSTRESPEIRKRTLALGVSQISAGSRTDIGGYTECGGETPGQFQLGDHRSLEEVVCDLLEMGYVPSFCTACYRTGRTGHEFMDLAKPGDIKGCCDPNALSTLTEYLVDYASSDTAFEGERLINKRLHSMDSEQRLISLSMISRVRMGQRDVFV